MLVATPKPAGQPLEAAAEYAPIFVSTDGRGDEVRPVRVTEDPLPL